MCMSYPYSHKSELHTIINGLLHPFVMASVPFVLVHYWKEVLRTGYHALRGEYVESDARFNQGSDWIRVPEPPGNFDPLDHLLYECTSGYDEPNGLKGTRHGCFLASLGLLICGIVFLLSKNSISFDSLYRGLFLTGIFIWIQFVYKIMMIFYDGDHPNKDKIGLFITLFGFIFCKKLCILEQPILYLSEHPLLIAGFIFLSGIILMIYSLFFSASYNYNSGQMELDVSNYKFLKRVGVFLLSASFGTMMLLL